MAATQSLGRAFGWLWAAFAISTFGTWIAFDALPLIAILMLRAGPTEVSILAAACLAVGAAVAVPLGPWIEFRRKRPVMIAMDLIRYVALISIPVVRARLAQFCPAPDRVGHRWCGQHRFPGGERRIPENSGAPG